MGWQVVGFLSDPPRRRWVNMGGLVAILSAGLLAQLAEHWGTNPRSLVQAQ